MKNEIVSMIKGGMVIRVAPEHVKSKEASGWKVKPKPQPETKPETRGK